MTISLGEQELVDSLARKWKWAASTVEYTL